MSLVASCPRCTAPVVPPQRSGDLIACPEHGLVSPLWRPATPGYAAFVEHLRIGGGMPTYLPWPLVAGWQVGDNACVPGEAVLAVVTGHHSLDGDIEVAIVTEESGVGLGPRMAGTAAPHPGLWGDPPSMRIRVEGQPVPLWPVSVLEGAGDHEGAEWDRSVLIGEYAGRWLWLVVRPASAVLLLADDWTLRDVSGMGPALVELPFGGAVTPW